MQEFLAKYMPVDASAHGAQLDEQWRIQVGDCFSELRQSRQGVAQRPQVSWPRRLQCDSRQYAFDIANALQLFLQRRGCAARQHRLDCLVAAAKDVVVAQGTLNPAAQQA